MNESIRSKLETQVLPLEAVEIHRRREAAGIGSSAVECLPESAPPVAESPTGQQPSGQQPSATKTESGASTPGAKGAIGEARRDSAPSISATASDSRGSTGGSKDDDGDTLPDDLIGVALSGGGIRSAAFGLGVLQSLYQRGVLRFADYLSTVSGGSYLGSFLTSLALDPLKRLRWDAAPNPDSPEKKRATSNAPKKSGSRARSVEDALAPTPSGQQPDTVKKLIHGGDYLKHPVQLVTHWLPGFLAVNLVGFSGLVFVCAVAAFLFRCLDYPWMMRLTHCLGFQDDVMRAFFPSFLTFVIWSGYWVLRASRALFGKRARVEGHGQSKFAKTLTMALVVITLLSAVSLLGVADISTRMLETRWKLQVDPERKEWLSRLVSTALYSFVVIGLLPYLNPRALLRSGTDPRRPRDRYIFQVTTFALAWGMPLGVFAFLAREDLSYFNSWRQDRDLLTKASLVNGPLFFEQLQDATLARNWTAKAPAQSESTGSASYLLAKSTTSAAGADHADEWLNTRRNIWCQLVTEPWNVSIENTTETIDNIPTLVQHWKEANLLVDRYDAANTLVDRLWDAVVCYHSVDFSQQWTLLTSKGAINDLLTARINYQLLSDPEFFVNFKPMYDWIRANEESKVARLGRFNDERLLLLRQHYESAQALHQRIGLLTQKDDNGDYPTEHKGQLSLRNALKIWRDNQLKVACYDFALVMFKDREIDGENWRTERAKLLHPIFKESEPSERAELQALLDQMQKANFGLWKAFFGPDEITDERKVYAMIVHGADQRARGWIAGISLAIFLVFGLLVNLNSTTLHGFYLDRLSSQWLVDSAHRKGTSLRLEDLDTAQVGAPYLLVNAALTMTKSVAGDGTESTEGFLLSKCACGAERLGFAATDKYGEQALTLADAMAISGAAVTPTVTTNFAVRALMWMGNLRLGQWLPNPRLASGQFEPSLFRPLWRRPTPLYLLASRVLVENQDREFHFVGDGGLYENLGIEALLMRRCRLIIAIDAAVDPNYQFADLVNLAFRARVRHGIELRSLSDDAKWGLDKLEPNANDSSSNEINDAGSDPAALGTRQEDSRRRTSFPKSEQHFLVLKVKYPDAAENQSSYLIYVRPSFTGDEPDELRTYCKQNQEFPQDSTVDQFFEPRRFEAYRFLGQHIGEDLCKQIFDELTLDLATGRHLIERMSRPIPSKPKNENEAEPSSEQVQVVDAAQSSIVTDEDNGEVDEEHRSAKDGLHDLLVLNGSPPGSEPDSPPGRVPK